ncbi:hypothetical protein BASA83_009103 [Batrachochytrium salamandrivorans]|nr:hypothetical protein BASA83_009103 [Batrachochytrium salamandrivorans]
MDIDFVRRGPLSSLERENRMKQGLCLVCGGAGHRKANCPSPGLTQTLLGISALFKRKRTTDAIHYSSVSSPASKVFRSHTNVPPQSSVSDPCFWISSLSSLNKLLLPGTLHFGSAIHADTFFIDCGADDVFMDAELADRLNIPLVKIPVPIKLRLADGDSSSMITHRHSTPSVAYGRHVETIGFYVTSLCHGIILGYSWLERHNPQINWESRMVDFGSSYCLENCCVVSTRIQGLGKPPRTSDISPKISIPEPEISDQTSNSAVDSAIDLSLFKDPSMDLRSGCQKASTSSYQRYFKISFICRNNQAEVYPFLEVSPVSKTTIPSEIDKEFSSVFSESQANILAFASQFDCTINLSSSAEPSYGRIYQLTREEDKQKDKLRLAMDYRGLNKQTVKDRNPIVNIRNA